MNSEPVVALVVVTPSTLGLGDNVQEIVEALASGEDTPASLATQIKLLRGVRKSVNGRDQADLIKEAVDGEIGTLVDKLVEAV